MRRKRPTRAAASAATTAMALAAITDRTNRPSAKRAKTKKRYPKPDEEVCVWDTNWGKETLDKGRVISVNKSWMMVKFDAINSFEIPLAPRTTTFWTQDKDVEVPPKLLAGMHVRMAKAAEKATAKAIKKRKKSYASAVKSGARRKVRVTCTQCKRCCACWERAVSPNQKGYTLPGDRRRNTGK